MKSNQAEQLDINVLNKNQDTDETILSPTSKQEKASLFLLIIKIHKLRL